MPRNRYHCPLNRRDPVTGKRIPTRTEEKILAVLINPKYHKKSNADKVRAADCSFYQFYKIMRDQWFQNKVKEVFMAMLGGEVLPILDASVETAREAGRDGFNDRKMLLEMAGLYGATLNVNHSGQVDVSVEGEVKVEHQFDVGRFQQLYLERTRGGRPRGEIVEEDGN